MHRVRFVALSTFAVLLELLPLVTAHGTDHDDSGMANMDQPPADTAPEGPMSYWNYPEHTGLMYAHILFMIVAWVVIAPAGVMLSIAKSRLALPLQFLFLILNAVGLTIGVIYDQRTPNLYKNDSHSKMGWALTWILSAWVVMGLINAYVSRGNHGQATHPMSRAALAQYQRVQSFTPEERLSRDSGQGTERNSESLFSHSRSPSDDSETQRFHLSQEPYGRSHDDEDDFGDDAEKRGFLHNTSVDRFLSRNLSKLAPFSRALRIMNVLYIVIERSIPVLGFVAISTGAVVLGGIADGGALFNVLAHFVKGGIFFWYGLLTLGRWLGCFADFGWAWNVKPPSSLVGRRRASIPSAEFTESFVIFLYGVSNVFLEHLAAWGGAWTAQDLEHVSISIMFFGGGLLGMLVESQRVRGFLNVSMLARQPSDINNHNTNSSYDNSSSANEQRDVWTEPKTYRTSLNPLPAIIILLLGTMMSAHHQDSMLSTMIHKQWGTLFVVFALARGVTYILLYISPPTSYLPARPPSELVSSFCLVAGGVTFILSNKDTVKAMDERGLDAMFSFTVTIGGTCLLMTWMVVVVALKGWAERKRRSTEVAFLRERVSMPA